MSLLEVNHMTIQFGGLVAVSDFNLHIEENEIVGLIGPNGAGKTTSFNVITGEYRPTKGSIGFMGKDISRTRIDRITKLGIARTFQNIRLFRNLSVLENVLIANHLNLKSNIVAATFKFRKYLKEEKAMYEKSLSLLEETNLLKYKDDQASSLPYGQQRRLEIARALATDPKLLLLDEPAAGMNPQESLELMNFIREIKSKFNLTIFMIEHHMPVIMGVCERILVLDHGITIAEGTPKEIQSNAKVIFAPGNFTESSLIIKQAREQGITTPILGGDTWEAPEFLDIGGPAVEGAVFSTFFTSEVPITEESEVFLKAYRDKFDKEPASVTALGYDAYLVIRAAIEKANSTDPVAIRDEIAKTTDFVGAAGMITLDENGDAVKNAVIKKVQDGKFVYQDTIEPAK
jgi:branched-chain amino acid transport system ATP-binding protein